MKYLEDISPNRLKRYFKDPLRKNAIFLIVANALAAILGLVFWVIVARLYPAEEVGLATALISAMILVSVVSRLGFDIGLIRFLPRGVNKRDIINSCFTIAGLFSIVLAIIFISGLNLWTPKLLFVRENAIYPFIFILATMAITLCHLQQHVFIAFRATEFILIRTVVSGLRILFAILLVGFGVIGIFSSWGLSIGIAFIVGNIFIVKLYPWYRLVPTIRKKVANDMFHFSFGNYIAEGLREIPRWTMPLIIIGMLTPEMSAYFYMAWTIVGILFIISYATNFSLFAQGSYQPGMLRGEVIKAAKFIFLLLVPMIIAIFLLGDEILSLFGAEYAQNGPGLLRLLALSSIPLAITTLYVTINRVQMKVKPLIYVNSFITIFTIGVSTALMNTMGIIGIGIGWLVANGIVAAIVGPMMLKMAGISVKGLLKLR